jgi:hypothetical protein
MSRPRRVLGAALACIATVGACEPGGPAPSPGAGGGDPGGGGGGAGGGGGSPALDIVFERGGAPAGVTGLDLELVGVTLFGEGGAPAPGADVPCDGRGVGLLARADANVPLDLTSGGETPIASLEPDAGVVSAIWLVLRKGVLHRGARAYKVHATVLCTMPDGLQYTAVVLRPGAPLSIEQGIHRRVVVPFDAGRQLDASHVRCPANEVEECQSSDDPDDDADAATRLRYAFPATLTARVEEPP